MAIQLLRVLAPVRIVAADVDDKKLEQAKTLDADHIVNNRNADAAAEQIQKITGPRGAGLVLVALVCNRLSIWTQSSSVATACGQSSGWAAAITIFITAVRRTAPQ